MSELHGSRNKFCTSAVFLTCVCKVKQPRIDDRGGNIPHELRLCFLIVGFVGGGSRQLFLVTTDLRVW